MDFKPFKIGKYLLLEKLATGGMAEVYRAKASGAGGFEKQLAIKRILPTYSANEEFRRMFEYEARLSSMLTHANIVQVYDFVKSGETYLLAMEYVDGKNLRQFVNKARKVGILPPVEFGVYVINEVAKGLEYAHKKKDDLTGKPLNIIHRDMSPQNIMLSYDGAVKIVDFGIAKAKDRVDETRSGVIKGKFGYMSPEQANGESVDHRTDIFSTGIILFEMLTGKRLFAAESDMATLRQIQECLIPPPSRLNPKISAELERIMLKALAKDITSRFQNAGNFHRALLEFLNKHYPAYTQKEVAELLTKVFTEEIENEKKRFEQLHRQSIPFSQQAQKPVSDDLDGVEDALEGSITKSEAGGNTAVTFVEELEDENESVPEPAPRQTTRATQKTASKAKPAPKQAAKAPVEEEEEEGKTEISNARAPIPDEWKDETAEPEISSGGDTQNEPPAPEEDDFVVEVAEPEEDEPEQESTNVSQEYEAPPPEVYELPLDTNSNASTGESVTKEKTRGQKAGAPETPVEEFETSSSAPTAVRGLRTNAPASGGTKRGSQITFPGGEPKQMEGSDPTTGTGTRRRPATGINEDQLKNRPASRAPVRPETQSGFRKDLSLPLDEKNMLSPLEMGSGQARNETRENRIDYYPEREEVLFEKKRALIPNWLKLLLFIGLVGYGYHVLMDGQVNTVLDNIEKRDPVSVPSAPATTESAEETLKKPAGGCTIEITTDPEGADVLVGSESRGLSPTTVTGVCNKAIDITLKHEGFETLSANMVLTKQEDKLYKTLKRVPMGTLELTVNVNAKLYLDNNYVGDVTANKKFEKPLRARVKYTIRLVNEILGVETTEQIFITDDAVLRKTIRLEQQPPTKPVTPPKPTRRTQSKSNRRSQ